MDKIKTFLNKHDVLVMILVSIVMVLLVYRFTIPLEKVVGGFLPVLLILEIFVIFKMKSQNKNVLFLIFLIGLLFRINYMLATKIGTRQHDVGGLIDIGHLGYIYTIFSTGKLPTTLGWQFYHPPFWHALGAMWLKINDLLSVKVETAAEGLQVLTVLLSTWTILIVDRIAQKMKLQDKSRYLADLFFAIHPTLIILSGSINNDCLLVFLEMCILLQAMKWYEKDSFLNTIVLAILTGLCVMTKLNGAMMAIPLIYMFLLKFIYLLKNDKKKIKRFICQMLIFGAISLPIGLWFQFRNYHLFGKIDVPNPPDWMYVGENSVSDRFLSFNFKEYFKPGVFGFYNLWAFLAKSAIIGEWFEGCNLACLCLILGCHLLLILISCYAIIKHCISKQRSVYDGLFAITFISTIISEVIFYIKYPYPCTMDFRYIVICLIPGVLALVKLIENCPKEKIKKALEILCVCFTCWSILLAHFF